jgi:hypothetical protein
LYIIRSSGAYWTSSAVGSCGGSHSSDRIIS